MRRAILPYAWILIVLTSCVITYVNTCRIVSERDEALRCNAEQSRTIDRVVAEYNRLAGRKRLFDPPPLMYEVDRVSP